MDTQLNITTLREVKPFKTSWIVRVKVLHTWISFSHQSGASLQMVLTDENGVKIHAACSQKLLINFEKLCVVGEWIVIRNFALRRSTGLARPTNHLYKMEFVCETVITMCNITCRNMFLDLIDFATIANLQLDPCVLIDVIGEIVEFDGLKMSTCLKKEVAKLEFTLRDIKDNRVRCLIMGKLAVNLMQEVEPLKLGDICLVRFARISNYHGDIQLNIYNDYSLVFANPDIKETHELKQRFNGVDNSMGKKQHVEDKVKMQERHHKWSLDPFLTIQEMKRCDKGGHCRVICSIYAIDTISGWYFHECMVCKHNVFKQTIVFEEVEVPKWWCDFCQHSVTNVETRYKLDLLVQDQTGEARFTLLDSEARFIVKTPAARIVNAVLDEGDNCEKLPEQLVDIVGKTYGFGISFDESINSTVSNNFKASKVWTLTDVIFKRTKSLHQNTTASIKKQCTRLESADGTSG